MVDGGSVSEARRAVALVGEWNHVQFEEELDDKPHVCLSYLKYSRGIWHALESDVPWHHFVVAFLRKNLSRH